MYLINPPRAPQARHVRYSVRHQARLDVETHTKLEELAAAFHRKRSAILRYVMQWGLTQTQKWTVDPSISDRPHLVHMVVDPELLQRVQAAAAAHGTDVAAWERHAMRLVTRDDFPPSWRAGETPPRSHDSSYYGTRFMLRLDEVTSRKLEAFTQTFDRSAAEIIRQLITRATPEDFPPSWHLAVEEHRGKKGRADGRATREETTS
jgi:predicted transcriptional regulator